MPDFEVQYGIPSKTYPIKARNMLSAGWLFPRNLPPGARPGHVVQFVSHAGHDAWFPWEGLISVDHRTETAIVTYEALGEVHEVTVTVRARSEEEAAEVLRQGCKTIKSIKFEHHRRRRSDDEDEEIEEFIEAWTEGW